MSTMPALDEQQVRVLVERALAGRQPRECTLLIEDIARHLDFWQVAVRPDRAGVRAEDYARVLTDVEEQLRDEQRAMIILTPVLV
ncbi:MAG: hypothetical protein AB1716_10240 [Planctomycetota bacterium]